MNPQRIAIIGAGLARATAAVTLREEGFDGEIHLIGAERQLPQLPYQVTVGPAQVIDLAT